MWVFTVLLVIIAGLVGYVIGDRTADRPDESSTTASGGTVATATGAPSYEDVLASVTPGADGSRGDGAKETEDGGYDAMFWGPRGPLQSQADMPNIHRRNVYDPFAVGAIDAPVVISEFSDFECPFCSLFANDTEPTILSKYVDTGLVRMEWNDLPINGPNAEAAARAGRAAAEQGRFVEFKHALYNSSKNVSGHPNYGIEDFVRFAEEAGVPDMEKFRTDATSDKYDEVIANARAYASSIGVSGTPGFVIGETFIGGAQPLEVFEEVINTELKRVADGEAEVTEPDTRSAAELTAAGAR
ncbi:thioredoxin domain-containing protein [Corynebacterium sp. CCM 8864]|uniref:Thioredoxin domain-containing protein n=1 Tax=Corynebacterium marambiense TaxID=2765364 RepID=A0ABS0VW56_9CORY|nr:thioredoxin domain-containing protein [Corynebacterium marambiense]MBI8999598.1 thioredoxin domain-containing protein [Corynebacterium marambiense]